MKGIFWNNRGLSDFAKTRFLRETSKEQHLSFIALLETGKKDFSQDSLNNFSGGRNFVWHLTVPHGRSGGISLGVNLDVLDVGSIDDGDFFVKFRLRDRKSDFKWVLVVVYGAGQPEFKESLLTELVQSCNNEKVPLCIGVILTSFGIVVKRTMIDLRRGGPFFLMRSLIVWTYER
jgi:hypothetical protein